MLAKDIKQKAAQLDYNSCGIIPATPFYEYLEYLDKRVEDFPASKDHYARFYSLIHPPEDAESLIVCIRSYNRYRIPHGLDKWVGKNYLFDGRVPYSEEARAKTEFEAYLETGGMCVLECQVPARWAAARAGLGKFGRNNFIYVPQHGSYHYIYVWAVDKTLDYDEMPESVLLPQCSDHCEKCIKACPTQAMAGGLSMDMGRCAARITSYAGPGAKPDEATMEQMGELLYGCDICQDACPVNQEKFTGDAAFPLLDRFADLLQPESLLAMDEETYRAVLSPRFWYAGKDGLWLWKCNALRILIHSGDEKYHDLIRQYCSHEDKRLQAVARWGCRKLGIESPG